MGKVAVMETCSGSEEDLDGAIERLLPVADLYRHRHGSLGHGRDHVLPAFVAPSLVLPVLAGTPALGTWQSIVLVDRCEPPDLCAGLWPWRCC